MGVVYISHTWWHPRALSWISLAAKIGPNAPPPPPKTKFQNQLFTEIHTVDLRIKTH